MKNERGRRKQNNSANGREEKRRHTPKSAPDAHARRFGRRDLLISAGLVVTTLAVYAQVANHEFINLDDDIYVYENPMVRTGLSVKGLVWAFTTFHAANWHPLTWVSHMLDAQIFGVNPGAQLAINVLLHILNSLLVFSLFRNLTGRVWRSAVVAALFALHPMHVESVAWVAERKDVLSTFFGVLSLLAYARYANAPAANWKRFVPVTITLAFALMAKPMFVTWPFVMLLMDFWPLGRLEWRPRDGVQRFYRVVAPLLREKIPVFILVAASSTITYVAQSRGGAVREFADAPLSLRIANAVVSYAGYCVSLLWPSGLGVYYPFSPAGIPLWQLAAALAFVAGVTTIALRTMKERGYLITGWAWYLGTLVPVIGLVQVGGQAMADRYTYIPSIGLFVIVVWAVADLAAKRCIQTSVTATVAVVLLSTIGLTAWVQAGYWRDSVTLYRHTLKVAPNNLVAHYNLGHALGKQGNLNDAVEHFGAALRIKPDFLDALIDMGITLNDQGKFAEATTYLGQAVELRPDSTKAHLQLGIALAQTGASNEALERFYRAFELAPGDSGVRTNLGLMLARLGRLSEAREHLTEAVRLDPTTPEAHNNLGLVLLMQGDAQRSIAEFTEALRLKPDFKLAQENLNRARQKSKPEVPE